MTMTMTIPCALLLLGAVSGCAGLYPTPPPPRALDDFPLARLDRVAEGVYRGAQPSEDQFRALVERYQIRTVVKLNPNRETRDRVPNGVTVVYRPLNPLVTPSHDELARILDAIDAAKKPVFVHCQHGEDRTGLLIALYKIRHGATVDAAYLDMQLRGFHPYRGLWRAFTREVGWTKN